MHEASLINLESDKLYSRAKRTSADTEKILADRIVELKVLINWWDYLRSCISNQYSSLPPSAIKRPDGDCMPRTRLLWLTEISLLLGNEDPFLSTITEFCVAYMLSTIVRADTDVIFYRDELLAKLSKRLKTAQDGKTSRDGASKAGGLHQKPTPRRR